MASASRAAKSKNAKKEKILFTKRTNLLASVKRIRDFNDNYDETRRAEVPFYMERLDKLWEDVERVEDEFDVLLNLGEPAFAKERAEFQVMYFRLKGSLATKLAPPPPPPASVRLPEVKMPEFDGRPEEWTGFYDLFKSMVHTNASLSEIQKLHYLRASLKGDAARIICSLPIAATSYAVAWKLIVDRYEDKHLLIKQHIAALFSIAPLRKESANGLSELLDEFEKHVQILDTLESKEEHWDSVLVELLFSRMDVVSQKEWESRRDKSERPSYADLVKFVHEQSRTLQSLKLSHSALSTSENKPQKPKAVANHSTSEQSPKCVACKQAHYLFQCEQFRGLTIQQRFDLVKRHNLCINCIKASHMAKNCSSGSCKYCQKKHHTLLHMSSPALVVTHAPPHSQASPMLQQPYQQYAEMSTLSHPPHVPRNSDIAVAPVNRFGSLAPSPVQTPFHSSSGYVAPPSHTSQTVAPTELSESTVLLFTALIKVQDNLGQYHYARALLDSGSQSSFVSESLSQRLSLRRKKVNMPVSGIGQAIVNVRYTVTLNIASRFGANNFLLDCLVLPKLTVNLPTRTVDVSAWKIPADLPLADPQFHISHGVDIIIGAELFLTLLEAEKISFDDRLPALQKTSLGYVVAGRVPTLQAAPVTCLVSTLESIDGSVKKFWEVENFDQHKALTAEEQQCETHFLNTYSRNADGRFIVRLPLRDEMLPAVGDTWPIAARRFAAVERRMRSDDSLRSSYVQFMDEYKQLGHMEEVQTRDALPQYFLPHHAIHRPDSSTTKTRVVFDGSAKSSNHIALNDMLLTGPTVQPALLSIVLNFRLHRYVMTVDIEKMFRQILVHPDDRSLQQIVWRPDPSEPLKNYQLNTVTYGTSCAPFLAARTLNQLALDDGDRFPLAAPVVPKDFYVDDLLTGADDIEQLVEVSKQLTGLLEGGGFSLRKWSANHPDILEHIPDDRKETLPALELDQSPSIKTLGLLWFPAEDNFGFKIPKLPNLQKVTKRIALSEMSQLFDPLGLVGPAVASAKMFVQQLWQENLGWDDELPEKLQTWWLSFRAAIVCIQGLRVPRWVLGPTSTSYDLHCFVDASEKGYGCCIYVVSRNSEEIEASNLLIAKSRVAPASGLTIPRLELCAAVLGSQLVNTLLQTTKFSGKTRFWSDSTIVLNWIHSPPGSWRVFVSNRIAEIQRLTQGSQWRHVPTALNPADRISRGVEPQQLLNDSLWWYGPSFLKLRPESWPNPVLTLSPAAVDQQSLEKKGTVALTTTVPDDSLIRHYSELARLLRIASYCYRFLRNCRTTKHARTTGPVTPAEFYETLKSLVCVAQRDAFPAEIAHLQKKQPGVSCLKDASFKSPLKNLDLVLHSDGLLRLNGRLAKGSGSFDSRFPIILPTDHHLTHLIARSIHHQTLHAGPTQLLATVRQRFWPIRGRDLARRTVHRCVTCFRCRPKPSNQYMAPLPTMRITPAKVFENTGIDYCGPFFVRPLAGKGASVKVWVVVYVCFVVKAVVLDFVFGLSAASCVNSLRRFVGRVGRVQLIHCDNSTTFVGAAREVKEMRQQFKAQFKTAEWRNECLEKGIDFQFIPPRAAHFGGLWEAAVKIFKHHLVRIIGSSPFQLDDFRTAIAQAEGIMNSRPLTPLSNNPEDLSVLTPGHFLVGEPTFCLPEPDVSQIPTNRLDHYQATQKSVGDLWKRWSKEYVGLLHQRPAKWRKQPTVFEVGSMVLIKVDNAPPKHWPLGRVVAIHPGADNIVRVVDVRTHNGIRRRATSELCVLPMDDGTKKPSVEISEDTPTNAQSSTV